MIAERLIAASIEVTFAALIVMAAGAIIGRRSPRIVALLWLVVLAKPLMTLMAGSMIRLPMPARIVAPARRAEVQAEVMRVKRRGGVEHEQRRTSSRNPANVLVAIWIGGAILVLLRTIHGRLRLHSIIGKARPASARLRASYARLASNTPRLLVSDDLDGPAITGIFAPAILLPSWMEERADDAQIEWTLRHELRHATARDTLGIALREASLIAFWFHPLIWLAAQRWEAATELACDRDVVANDDDATEYADALYRTLLNVRRQPRLALAAGLFATRSKIGTRIAALVERPLQPKGGRIVSIAAALIGIAMVVAGAGFASSKHHRGHVEEVNEYRSMTLDYQGVITFSPLAVSPGGWIDYLESAEGATRRIRIDGDRRRFFVNGRAAPRDTALEKRAAALIAAQFHH